VGAVVRLLGRIMGAFRCPRGRRLRWIWDYRPNRHLLIHIGPENKPSVECSFPSQHTRMGGLTDEIVLTSPRGFGYSARIYRADELVPHSGIYKVTHGRGHLPQHTVTCVSGEPFPACNVCGRRVTFILVEAAHFIDRLQCFSLEPADSKAGLNWLDAPDEQGMFQSKFFWTKDRGGRSAELMELIGPSPLRLARGQVAPPRSTVSLRQNVRRLLECLI